METNEVIEQYAHAVRQHTAAVFLGAGTSISAGYPNWDKLIENIRQDASVPQTLTNAPLAAEYAEIALARDPFEKKLLDELNKVSPVRVPQAVQILAELPVAEYWTTNYDNLIEMALAGERIDRVVSDNDYYRSRDEQASKRVTKMHGSLTQNEYGQATWEQKPVITRGDFERYEYANPLIWAQLKAQFLTTSFLFVGFSFDDPNIEVLLRLSRSLDPNLKRRGHYATMRRPEESGDVREFELRVADLERSGINVATVDSFPEIDNIVDDVARRAKSPNVFVSGSRLEDDGVAMSQSIGSSLGNLEDIIVSSLAGQAGMSASLGFFKSIDARGQYAPERIRFFFRKSEKEAAPVIPNRIGAAFYTNLDQVPMREQVLDQVTAMIVIGGGETTRHEVDAALGRGVPVIPVGSISGTSKILWENSDPDDLNLGGLLTAESWQKLGSDEPITVATVVQEAVKKSI